MTTYEVPPELHELVQALTRGGFKIDLRPTRRVEDGATRQVYYAVRVPTEGLTPAQLTQLLAIVDGSPYDGSISDGRLVLDAERP